jgi:hypothetical protein
MVRPLSLNEKLHLIIPIYGDDGETVTAYVHSAPVTRETFDAHFMLIAKTFAAIYAEGLGFIAGPRVAANILREIADKRHDEVGAMALMNEIRRLTNVTLRTPQGWDAVPFQEVIDRGTALSLDEVAEVTNAIVFFIVTSAMQRKQDLKEMMDGAARLWGARTSWSGFTAFVASLGTSTVTAAMPNQPPVPASSAVY